MNIALTMLTWDACSLTSLMPCPLPSLLRGADILEEGSWEEVSGVGWSPTQDASLSWTNTAACLVWRPVELEEQEHSINHADMGCM